jgi:hypothetical protein
MPQDPVERKGRVICRNGNVLENPTRRAEPGILIGCPSPHGYFKAGKQTCPPSVHPCMVAKGPRFRHGSGEQFSI